MLSANVNGFKLTIDKYMKNSRILPEKFLVDFREVVGL